jgi:prepilin-type N-terminal cleavage/methylation domain-containing protein
MAGRKAGFTLIEVTIAAALASLVVALTCVPMMNGLAMAQRENTVMNMFRTGDITMTRLASLLQPAVLPAGEWRGVLRGGTDFLPFCTPVPYGDTGSEVDADGRPVLGITMPGGGRVISAAHAKTTLDNGEVRFRLDPPGSGVHPDLAALDPAFFGLGSGARPDVENGARFAARLAFPEGGTRGFGVVRFVPDKENGRPAVLREKDLLGPGADFDLNRDGTTNDVFARGALFIDYANDGTADLRSVQSVFPLTGRSVLLQLNTDSPGYVPLFRLVGAPSGAGADGILVSLLLFDHATQRGKKQFLTRQFQTFIEMRNPGLE